MTDYVYKPAFESKFKKHYNKTLKGGKYRASYFKKVYKLLLRDLPLPEKYNDHALVNRKPERDLHIKPDWILIFKYDVDFVRFIDTGSHSELFG